MRNGGWLLKIDEHQWTPIKINGGWPLNMDEHQWKFYENQWKPMGGDYWKSMNINEQCTSIHYVLCYVVCFSLFLIWILCFFIVSMCFMILHMFHGASVFLWCLCCFYGVVCVSWGCSVFGFTDILNRHKTVFKIILKPCWNQFNIMLRSY